MEDDELWSFVGQRENNRWIRLMPERRTRQIIALLRIGDRSQDSATALWANVPPAIKTQTLVLTDCREAYQWTIPLAQHTSVKSRADRLV